MSVTEGLLSTELLAQYGQDEHAIILNSKNKKNKKKTQNALPPPKSKSQLRKERLIELKKEKAARRSQLFESLSKNSLNSSQTSLLCKSGRLGQKDSLKQRLEKVMMESKLGIQVTEQDRLILTKEIDSEAEVEAEEGNAELETSESENEPEIASARKRIRPEEEEYVRSEQVLFSKPQFQVLGKKEKKKRRRIVGQQENEVSNEGKMEIMEEVEKDERTIEEINDAAKKARENRENLSVVDLNVPAIPKGSRIVPSSKKKFFVSVTRDEAIESSRKSLPIYGEEQVLIETINENPFVVVCGATGSGKTTQLPQFLLENGYGFAESGYPGLIAVTQPRRIAAVSTANRVSQELGSHGHLVGYHIRFDRNSVDEKTKIKFMTDGILLKEIQADFLLQKYSVVLLDEAHERNLNTDVLIGLLSRIVPLRVKKGLSPLKVVIMSATLRVNDFTENAALFPNHVPPVIEIAARQFPVVNHFNRVTPLTNYVDSAFKKVCKIQAKLPPGGILVFMTGKQEIEYLCKQLREHFAIQKKKMKIETQAPVEYDNEAEFDGDIGSDDEGVSDEIALKSKPASIEAMERLLKKAGAKSSDSHDFDDVDISNNLNLVPDVRVLPLYGLLSTEMQLQVFDSNLDPKKVRLIVVATNVAETSITIPGIRYVVDCGREKKKVYDKITGMSTFMIDWISQASADQRAGRAGRTGPGHCYRLYSSAVFNDKFHQFSDPEILNIPIDGMVLQLKSMGIHNVGTFPFPTLPEAEAMQSASTLLKNICALDPKTDKLTSIGETLACFPVSPRYAKMLAFSNQKNCLPYMIAIVALLSVGNLWMSDFHQHSADFSISDDIDADEIDETMDPRQAGEEKSKRQKAYNESRRYWSHRKSDLLGDMNVVLASDYSNNLDSFCSKYFVRKKALLEIRNLRKQLTRVVQPFVDGVAARIITDDRFGEEEDMFDHGDSLSLKDLRLQPASEEQELLLCQIIASGFVDQIAKKSQVGGEYECLTTSEPVCIHPHSYMFDKTFQPELLCYHELVCGSRTFMKGITAITINMLSTAARNSPLCSFSKPLESPAPYVDPKTHKLVGFVRPTFGPHNWKLPIIKIDL